ncbi:hypothetical protein LO771_08290 [Streptacidiphilus sp. ASG 303]|nr:hypothetical protein [Streptacidiphilus sp. ASG 303]
MLNRPGSLAPATLARVEAAIREAGYVRHGSAGAAGFHDQPPGQPPPAVKRVRAGALSREHRP